MTDDATLLRRYAEEQSEAAFAEFVQRHLPLVYAAALRRLQGDAHRAEDITQLVFCAAARDAQKLSRHTVLTGWLFTATRNAVIDTQRSESRRRTREEQAQAMQTVSLDPAADADWTRLQPVLDAALDELAASDREAVLLRFFQSRTFAEVGAAMGTSEEAARKRVERALDKLRALLDRRGIQSTSAALAVALAGQTSAAVPAGLAASVTSAAAAAGGAAWGAATFFSLTKLQAGLVAALMATGAVGLVRQQKSIAELRAELDRREQRVSALAKENRSLASPPIAAENEAERQRAAGSPRATVATSSTNSPRPPSATAQSSINVPETKRAAWHRRFDPFFRTRSFTPAQVGRIMELWFLQEQARLDLQAAVVVQGLRGDAEGIEALRSQLYAPITREVREILGLEAYTAYGKYEGTSYFRMIVADSLSAKFARAKLSLSSEQIDRLADLVRIHRTSERAKATDIGTTTHVDWRTVADKARDVLTPEQVALLQEFAAQQPAGR